MGNKSAERYRKRLFELEGKVRKLRLELEANQSKLKSSPEPEIEEAISYLKDWIEFNLNEVERYKAKLKTADQKEQQEKLSLEKNIEDSFNFIFEAEKPVEKAGVAKEKPGLKAVQKSTIPLIKYALPFAVILLIAISLFLLKTSITGYVVLGEETAYNETLNLKINESGTYEWNIKNPGSIKSLKATGSITGNGTVKIYIEKNGSRYLVYKNK